MSSVSGLAEFPEFKQGISSKMSHTFEFGAPSLEGLSVVGARRRVLRPSNVLEVRKPPSLWVTFEGYPWLPIIFLRVVFLGKMRASFWVPITLGCGRSLGYLQKQHLAGLKSDHETRGNPNSCGLTMFENPQIIQ